MAEKEEVRYYSDNKIEINGKIYNVTFTFLDKWRKSKLKKVLDFRAE